jgi:ribokinase
LNPAPAAVLDAELVELTDILVPNEHEAATLEGMEAPPAELAKRLSVRFGCSVVVTAGALGCFVEASGISDVHCPAPAVPIADTTGAGDTFVAGLAVRLRLGDDLASAAAFAVAAASISVSREGTMPSYPTAAELTEQAAELL